MSDEALTSEQVAEMRKKRTFRKFTFRGIDLDKLLDLSMEVSAPHSCPPFLTLLLALLIARTPKASRVARIMLDFEGCVHVAPSAWLTCGMEWSSSLDFRSKSE